jgi:hypothetical protein
MGEYKKIEIAITGRAFTFLVGNETEEQARNRVAGRLLEGEIRANEHGGVRFHINLVREEENPKASDALIQHLREAIKAVKPTLSAVDARVQRLRNVLVYINTAFMRQRGAFDVSINADRAAALLLNYMDAKYLREFALVVLRNMEEEEHTNDDNA